ncbi:MAG: hypothetical protein OEV00_09800, partial [Acidobacteriota bacterium]|nr:hypothetical protein [Acidobacteriota bacterium]
PDGNEKLVLALKSNHLVVIDVESREVDVRMKVDDIQALAVADTDGDGRDEIAVSAGRRLFILERTASR